MPFRPNFMHGHIPRSSLIHRLRRGALVCALSLCGAGAAHAAEGQLGGTISYGGSQAGLFHVLLTSVAQGQSYSTQIQVAEATMSAAGVFLFDNVKDGTYNISAYIDANGNGALETGEPFGFFQTGSATNPESVQLLNGTYSTAPTLGYGFQVNDEPGGTISGAVTYSGSQSGTLYVRARIPNPYGGGNLQTLTFATAAVTGAGTYNYSMLAPNATFYTLNAFLDTSGEGINNHNDSQLLSASITSAFTVAGGAVTGKDMTLIEPYSTGEAGSGVVTGSITYTGSKTGPVIVALINGEGDVVTDFKHKVTSSSQGGAFSGLAFSISNVSTVTYTLLVAAIDVNSDGAIGDEPIAIYGGSFDSATPVDFPAGGGTTGVGTLTIVDPPNGAIAGTIHLASGIPQGSIIVRAEGNNGTGTCDDNCEAQQVIPYVEGTLTYNYQVENLAQHTSYFVYAFVDANGNRKFDAPQSTAPTGSMNNFEEPRGGYGDRICDGQCQPTRPVAVTTTSGGGFNATTGIDFVLTAPFLQPPPVPTLSDSVQSVSAINWSWSTVAHGDGFRVVSSTDGNISGDFLPVATAWTGDTGLSTNTQYGRSVVAFNYSGNSTSTLVSKYTLAAPATDTVINNIWASSSSLSTYGSSVTVSWANNTNPAWTSYTVIVSSGANPDTNNFPGNQSSTTFNTSAVLTNLLQGATHYFRVRADNGDGVATAYDTVQSTFIPPFPDRPVASGSGLGVSSITWSWTGTSYSGGFRVISSTGGDLSGVLDYTQATFIQTGLSTNTAHTVTIVSFNTTGSTNSAPATAFTHAVTPAPVAVAVVSSYAITSSWTPNTNPAGTVYVVVRSTGDFQGGDNGFTGNVSSLTQNTVLLSTGLAGNTTYYFSIGALSGDSVFSDFGLLGSTTTLAGPVAGVSTAPVSTHQITWSWTAVTDAWKYKVYAASSGILLNGDVLTNSYTRSGLSTNTANGLTILAVNAGGDGVLSTPVTGYTLADVPTPATFASVMGTSLQASWTDADNPAGTLYSVVLSSGAGADTNGLGLNQTSTTFNTSAPFTGLVESTTYYVRVKALNGDGQSSAYATETSTITGPPAVTGLSTAAPVGISSITFNWNAVSGALFYRVYQASSGVQIATSPAANLVTLTGLESNRAYGIRVSAVNPTAEGDLSAAATGFTLAAEPTPITFTAVSSFSLVSNWTANGNPDGTAYVASVSTDNFATVNATSATFNTSAPWSSLAADTTYYSRVRAINFEGYETADNEIVSTVTLPGTVVGLSTAPPIGVSSITWNWTAISGAHYYKVYQASSGVQIASSPAANTFTWTGLASNKAFGIRVSAVNGTGEGELSSPATGFTLATAPSAAPISDVAGTTLKTNWGLNGNPAGTTFLVTISTGAGASTNTFTGNQSSTTLNTDAVFASLTEATTYFAQVKAVNAEGFSSEFTTLGSTVTGPPAVTGLSTAAPLGISSITWNWTAIPSTLYYEVFQASSGVQIASSPAANLVTLTGLAANTAYGIRVRAVNATGAGDLSSSVTGYTLAAEPSASAISNVAGTSLKTNWGLNGNPAGTTFLVTISTGAGASTNTFTGNQSSTTLNTDAVFASLTEATTYFAQVKAVNAEGFSSGFTILGSTVTGPPAVTALSTAAPLGISSITWNWTAIGGTLFYRVYQASSGVQIASSPVANTFTWTGLTPNGAFGIRVSAVNATGEGDLSAAATGYTLAAVPSAAAFSSVSSTTLISNWGLNNNSAGTTFVVALSSGPGASTNTFTGNQTSTTFNTNASFAGLTANVTYYAQVKAVNFEGFSTEFQTLGATVTVSGPPPGVSTTTPTGISSMTWTWPPVAGALRYKVYMASSGLLLDGNLTPSTFTATGLSTNTAYGLRVQVETASGLSALSDPVTGYTLADAPLALSTTSVFQSSATLTWDTVTNPAGTNYEINWWFDGIVSSNTVTVTASPGTVTSLAAGTTLYFRVRAMSGDGTPTSFTNVVSTKINAAQENVSTGAETTVVFDGGSGANTITIPPSAFTETVQITVQLPSVALPAAPSGGADSLQGTGEAIEIVLDKPLQPKKPVALTMAYSAASVLGLDQSKLVCARYDTTHGRWIPLLSTPDPANRKVNCVTNHFSLFQVMLAAATNSPEKALVYPNPFRPSQGHTTLTFARLPDGARVRIYTLLGELVKDFSANSVGMASWDGTNESGADVSSGVYFAFIQGAGQKNTMKVAIQR